MQYNVMASVIPYPVKHTFEEGLLTDFPATATPRAVLTGGQNMHLLNDGLQGEQQILQADRGNTYRTGMPEGWAVLGSGGFNGIEYFLLAEVSEGVATGRGQIGSFPSPEPAASGNPDEQSPAEGALVPRYRPLHNFQPYLQNSPPDLQLYPFVADEFNFSLERPVQVEIQADYDGTVNIIFNEPTGTLNPPRLINSRFAQLANGRYRIIDRQGERDANLYSQASFSSTLRLFQRSKSLVQVEFTGLLDGGQLAGGQYQYFFAYVNQDNQPTDVIAWSPVIPVFDGSHLGNIRGTQNQTTRRVALQLTGLDMSYQFLRCYAVRRFGEGASEAVETTQLVPDQRLSTDALSFQHTGYEKSLSYDQNLLSLRTSDLETLGAMSQVDNMLAFVGGRSQVYDADALRGFAEQISLSAAFRQLHAPGVLDDGPTMGTGSHDPFTALDWRSELADGRVGGYLNPWNVANRLGYPTGEALAFGIVFRLKSGTDSAVFPVRGHDHLLDAQAYEQATAVLDTRGWAASGENLDGVYRFPQVSSEAYPAGQSIAAEGRVTIMGIDFYLPQIPANVREAAIGCYFVRLKRNPDRLAQGYGVATLTSVVSARDGETFDHFSDQLDFITYPNYGRQNANLKVLPAPAGIVETSANHLGEDRTESYVAPFEFASFQDNKRYQINPYRLAFYSPDTVADPLRLRTALHGRQLRMSFQGYVKARAVSFTTHPDSDGRGTFKVWKTVGQQNFFTDCNAVKSYWTEGGGGGANDGGFGAQEKYLMGKHENGVKYLIQANWDDYVGLQASDTLDSFRVGGSAFELLSNNRGSFGGEGTGHEIASSLPGNVGKPRVIAWLLNLYPQHTSDKGLARETQGARPRDVLRDIYSIDSEGYFPISPLLSLDQLEAGLDYERKFCCFGGDTYKGMSYRRLYTNLRADQATIDVEWTKNIVGQVLSMVCESDVNPYAGREKENQTRPGEGAPRSWWSEVWEDSGYDVRVATSDSFKAPESQGYNAGFANSSGATLQLTLPRNVPFRALDFPNQLAVTSPHVAGGFQNGYRRYVPGSAQTYNRELGSMLSLRTQGRTLVVGFERGVATVAVNERTQAGADSAGPTFLEVRQVLSPFSRVLSKQVGVLSQFATVATDEAVFGLDYTGAWLVLGGEFKRLSSLRVEKELLPRLRYLSSERATSVLTRFAQLSLDTGRGDVIFSLMNNAAAPPPPAFNGPEDPYYRPSPTSYEPDPVFPVDPYYTPEPGVRYDWSELTCLQLVYSYRLDKWLPGTSYRAQHHFSQNQLLYAIPLPGSDTRRPGIYEHGRNVGVYFDEPHECSFEVVITGLDEEKRQFILNNLAIVSTKLLPRRIDYEPLAHEVTRQFIYAPAPGNISRRNAEYREDRVLITIPADVAGRRQRARAVRVRVVYEPAGEPLRIDALLAWLAGLAGLTYFPALSQFFSMRTLPKRRVVLAADGTIVPNAYQQQLQGVDQQQQAAASGSGLGIAGQLAGAGAQVAGFIPGPAGAIAGAGLGLISALAMRGAQNRAREQYLQQKQTLQLGAVTSQNQAANYQGLTYAAEGGVVPMLEQGGRTPAGKSPPDAAPERYTVKNPSSEAQRYYQNAVPTMQALIGNKHDEVYQDEQGRECRANSCLSFATTVQEMATGSGEQPRTKAQLYNPEFTHTAARQGWVPIELKDARAGDRMQYWDAPYPGSDQQQRIADLGGQELIKGKYPAHMMVLSSGLTPMDEKGNYWGDIVQDGHEFSAADRARKTNVSSNSYVVYRYIGSNGQPTNDARQAVALNQPAKTSVHALGGPVPGKPAPPVAESTGVVQTRRLPVINRIAQVRDASARKYLESQAYGDPAHYGQDRILLNQYLANGSPNIQTSDTVKRARYRGTTNTMYINPDTPSDYAAELAHAQQRVKMGTDKFLNSAEAGYSLEDSNDPVKGRYGVPGQLEHDAHTYIEPKLAQELDNSGRNGYRNQRELNYRLNPTAVQRPSWLPGGPQPGFGLRSNLQLTPRRFKLGGQLPASVIAQGSLHSERHSLPGASGEDLGTHGIPIIAYDGGPAGTQRVAELERDELTMPHELSKQIEKLARNKEHDVLGQLVAEQLRTNTIPSNRYQRRLKLAEGGKVAAEQFTKGSHSLIMVGPDGLPQMALKGEERIFSREHTAEMVKSALTAKSPAHFLSLGKRVAAMLAGQDKRLAKAV